MQPSTYTRNACITCGSEVFRIGQKRCRKCQAYSAKPVESREHQMEVQREARARAVNCGNWREADACDERMRIIRLSSHRDRPKTKRDPVDALGDKRLKRAAEVLRGFTEARETGRMPVDTSMVPDPDPSKDDLLPPLKEPPSPPDPINRWRKGRRTTSKNGKPIECPPTFKPKNPKRVKLHGNDHSAHIVLDIARIQQRSDREALLWRSFEDAVGGGATFAVLRRIIFHRLTLRDAAQAVGLSGNGRSVALIKLNLKSGLKAVADILDKEG